MSKGVKKPTHKKECIVCKKEYIGITKARYCSFECNVFDRAEKKYTGVEGYDYFRCPVCNQKVKEINSKHAKMHGFESPTDFAKFYNLNTTKCQAKRDAMKGENNPAYDHGGKYSKFSKNFIHGYDEEWHMQSNAKMSKFRNENKELFKSNIEYWIKECNGNIEEAKVKYKEFQTRDLDYFIKKYGEEEGPGRYKAKTEKWLSTMNSKTEEEINRINSCKVRKSTHFYSKAEKELYASLKELFPALEPQIGVMYVTESGVKSSKIYDMALGNKIIEYHGDFWHANPLLYNETHVCPYTKLTYAEIHTRDNEKLSIAKNKGYEVLVVWEKDYNTNKESVIQECVQYLNS